jgi:hypothetical protein
MLTYIFRAVVFRAVVSVESTKVGCGPSPTLLVRVDVAVPPPAEIGGIAVVPVPRPLAANAKSADAMGRSVADLSVV